MKDKIVKLIDEVKASSPDAEEIIVCGTEEYINKIKECLPQDVSVKIVPSAFLPEQKDNLVYIIPIEVIKPIEFIFDSIVEKPIDKSEGIIGKYEGISCEYDPDMSYVILKA